MLLLPEHMFTKALLYQTSAAYVSHFWTDHWLAFFPNGFQLLEWPLNLKGETLLQVWHQTLRDETQVSSWSHSGDLQCSYGAYLQR